MKSTAPGPNTFDRNELLRQFDELQSIKCDKTDIVAQAMELSLIPTDVNNNLDIVNQAMKMSDITSDIIMDFWIDYKVIVGDTIEAMMRIKLRFSYIQMK